MVIIQLKEHSQQEIPQVLGILELEEIMGQQVLGILELEEIMGQHRMATVATKAVVEAMELIMVHKLQVSLITTTHILFEQH